MSNLLPQVLRARLHRPFEEGGSGRAAALRRKVSPATGGAWGQMIRRTGQACAAPHGRPKGKGKLDSHRAVFAEIIAQNGNITMPELAFTLHDTTGVHAHPNALSSLTKHLRKCTRFGREDRHRAGNAWSWTRRSGRRDANLHRGAHRRGHDRTLDRSRPRSIRPRSISAKALSRSLSDPSRRIPSCQPSPKPPLRPVPKL